MVDFQAIRNRCRLVHVLYGGSVIPSPLHVVLSIAILLSTAAMPKSPHRDCYGSAPVNTCPNASVL